MTNPLPTGTLLHGGGYRVEELLGQGGFGVVYRATHQQLQSPVAIKAIGATGMAAQQAFLDEARLLSRLRHPHLPRVTDYFIEGQRPYLVMDYIAGKDLEQLLAERGGPLPEVEVLRWLTQVLDAVTFLHNQTPPIIHRDIKPGNIRIAHDGTVYLVDFGIAKVGGDSTHTRMAARAVSPPFSPIEQYGGAVRTGPYSDVYALGATLYVLLSGTLDQLPEAVARQVGVALPSLRQINPLVSERLEQVVTQALQVDIHARYPSARELLAALTDQPAISATQPVVVPGRPCPRCASLPVTPNAAFCHACGAPVLLTFASLGRQLDDPVDLADACDQAWGDALRHLQSGMLLRWLEAYNRQALVVQLRAAQVRYPGDAEAALEAFLRPLAPQGVDLAPAALDFGTCSPGETPHLSVTIQRRHAGYIHGTARAEQPWLTVTAPIIKLRPHETCVALTISVAPEHLTSSDARHLYTSAVIVDTNHGMLRLPAQIVVSNPPRARIEPPSVHLGRVAAVRCAGGSVAIINEGGGLVNGIVRAEQPWLTVEAQQARFALSYCQHATVQFSVTTELLTPKGVHCGTLVWETDQGMLTSDVSIEVTPPYAVEPGDPTTAIRQPSDLVKLCDCEPRRSLNNWERGRAWLRSGRLAAALRFFGDQALAGQIESLAQEPDVDIGLERALRTLGAKPARAYKDNRGEVVRQMMGLFSRKPVLVEYAILNTSKRGYLHGYVRPLANWISVPEPRFGCLPGEESVVKLYPDYTQRAYGDLFEPVVE